MTVLSAESLSEWKRKSERGKVCGIFGCPNTPTVQCQHCGNWYCEEHRYVLKTPAHPSKKRSETEREVDE